MSETKIGPTRDYPSGKISDDDKGGLGIGFRVDEKRKLVILHFGTPMTWLGLDVETALGMSKLLKEKADELSKLIAV